MESVWSNGVKALKAFGLEPMQYAGKMDRMAYLKHDTGKVLCDFSLDPLYTKVWDPCPPLAEESYRDQLLAN